MESHTPALTFIGGVVIDSEGFPFAGPIPYSSLMSTAGGATLTGVLCSLTIAIGSWASGATAMPTMRRVGLVGLSSIDPTVGAAL